MYCLDCPVLDRILLAHLILTRIFHANLLQKPGSPMNAALDSNFDLSDMYSYSPASKFSPALSHQFSRLPRYDQYEMFGLTNFVSCLKAFFLSTIRASLIYVKNSSHWT